MPDHKELWQQTLEAIRAQLPADIFNVWFKDAESMGYDNGLLTIGVPSEYFVMQYENRLYKVLRSALKQVYGPGVKIQYTFNIVSSDPTTAVTIEKSTSDGDKPAKQPAGQQRRKSTPESVRPDVEYEEVDSQLNDIYTFENYCQGASNRLVCTIAESIGNNPRKTDFNPFFLYGNTGVGKTHLMQAIGLRVKQNKPDARVLYVRARTFANQYGNAVREKHINDFVNFYQSIEVLLIDDIQELTGQPGIQNAFFQIFSYLHQKGTLLVMTSDRPPVALEGIMERLVNRFKWGVTEELPGPDFELRKVILRKKSIKNGLALPEDVINVIAASVSDSVRELEGIVISLIARAALMNQPITPQLATVVMQSTVKLTKRRINFDMIVENVAQQFDLDPDVIFSRSRVRDIADARQVIMYLAYKLTDLSSKMIGYKLSRSHVTVLHGIKATENRISLEPAFAQQINTIEQTLQTH
ncbi:MAG: chromosomal replication initiator protein DnaA [Prevotella sp.]|nr:chromosomal replication initiator protein DnaA [Prevotella sp.]MCM1074055.1 chromosomal replication initiator protein DnaA [Ruminococcus sp.]